MLKKIIKHFLRPRHPWRTMGFDGLSEIYISQLVRSLALNTMSVFVPIFLYRSGVSLTSVFYFYMCWFFMRVVIDLINGFVVGRIGPKKSMIMATFVHCVYLLLLLFRVRYDIPLVAIAAVGSYAYGLHILAVHVDFSRAKHVEHGGKELSYLSVCEKLGGVLGPLLGGILAALYGAQVSIGVAFLLLALSTIPLVATPEFVQTKQKITYAGLDVYMLRRDYMSWMAAGTENAISIAVWPLFVAVFILQGNPYARLGALTAASTCVAIIVTRMIGKNIDNKRGLRMLRIGIVLNACIHLVRPFVSGSLQVLGVNLANEPVTSLYRMPYIKGLYDAADSLPGYRIAYFASMGSFTAFGLACFWALMWALSYMYEPKLLIQGSFVVAGVLSLLIGVERFKALRV